MKITKAETAGFCFGVVEREKVVSVDLKIIIKSVKREGNITCMSNARFRRRFCFELLQLLLGRSDCFFDAFRADCL